MAQDDQVARAPTTSLYTLDGGLPRAQVLDELAELPSSLRQVLGDAPADALLRAPAPGEWSAFQTVCHVRDAAFIYALRFRYIVFDSDPFLPDYDENNWVAATRDGVEDVPEILDEIADSRADLMRVLRRLDESAWRRSGRHELIGPVVLEDYVRHQLAHERGHLAQIRRALTAAMP